MQLYVALVLGQFVFLFPSSDGCHCLTVVQPSVVTTINDLPVMVNADQVVVCDEGKVQTLSLAISHGVFHF